jgi:hypothetical protein
MSHLLARSSLGLIVAFSCCAKSSGTPSNDAAPDATDDSTGAQDATDDSVGAYDAYCAPDAWPVTGPPPQIVGCYVGTVCWQKVPCNCELSIENPAASVASVQFAFTVTPAMAAPSLSGDLEITVAFDDPDASWYAAWATQAEAGTTFAVTKAAGTTTVTLVAASVALPNVPLPASASREVWARVIGGPWSTSLDMDATLTNAEGAKLAHARGSCVEVLPL